MAVAMKCKKVFQDIWQENRLVTAPAWLSNAMAVPLFFYAFFMMTSDPIGSLAQKVVVTIGFAVWLYYGGELRKTGASWLLVAAILIPMIPRRSFGDGSSFIVSTSRSFRSMYPSTLTDADIHR